ncbi:MAG: HEAT repeat domain-containing protein [Planctomycetes bacterium]|nr:HEAT repeat domain-containing protein [Planctomycetota bacterium]
MNPRAVPLAAFAAVLLACTAHAHGGMYRGPGNVVPTAPGSSTTGPGSTGTAGGPSSGGAGGGSTTGTGTGTAPASGAGAGPAAGPTTGAGVPPGAELGEDLTRWSYWWEFRKDPFLDLRRAVHDAGTVPGSDEFFLGGDAAAYATLRPTAKQVTEQVLPSLQRMLESTEQRDITSSCLIALAKIGVDSRYSELLPTLRSRLASHDQEIRETAALAMGISQRVAALPDLLALAGDTARGRSLCERSEVDDRTRTFALYGLGLVAWASDSATVKSMVLDAAKALLEQRDLPGFNLHVAAIGAIGLLRPELAGGEAGARVRRDALAALDAFYAADLGVGRQLVQAHVPPAMAALLRGEPDRNVVDSCVRRLVAELEDRGDERRRARELAQSAVLALGDLARPNEEGAADAWISDLLCATFESARDQQTRYFALMALGTIGGSRNRDLLIGVLESGQKALERTWAALALGTLEFVRRNATPNPDADPTSIAALRRQLAEVRNPDALGAIAVGLGLCGARDAADDLRTLLEDHRSQDELAGYLCIGLALMDDRAAIEPLRRIVASSARRPQLLLQAAIALGRLGDKSAATLLTDAMRGSAQNIAVMSSLAFAIGSIGDRRSIDALVGLMRDDAVPDLSRAFAVVALGGVADKEPEPWNAKIGRLVNYRAAVETLTNQVSGVLDIL